MIAVFLVLFLGALTRFALSDVGMPYTVVLCIIGAIVALLSQNVLRLLEGQALGVNKSAPIYGQSALNILYELCMSIRAYGNVDAHLVL